MIIDIHTHLGDILNPNGGLLIFRKGVRKQKGLDVLTMSEQRMYQTNGFSEWFFTTLGQGLIIKATRARNLTATLENFQRSMDENKVAQSACMPVAPHVTFDDLRGAMASDARIIPFTSVNFSVNRRFRKPSELKICGKHDTDIDSTLMISDNDSNTVFIFGDVFES